MSLTKLPLRTIDPDVPISPAALASLRRSLRMTPDLLDYSATGTESDWAPIIEAAIADVVAEGENRLYVPPGQYDLLTNVEFNYPVTMFGNSISTSVFTIKHDGTGVSVTGENGTGGRLSDLSFGFNAPSGAPVAQIQLNAYQNPLDATDHYSPDFFDLVNLNLTHYGGTIPAYNLILDGNMRDDDNGGSVQLGLRAITLSRIEMFSASTRALEIRHCRVLKGDMLRAYGGTGVGGLYIGGSGSGTKSAAIDLSGCIINGDTVIEQSVVGSFLGGSFGGALTGNSTATDWTILSSSGSTVTNNLANSTVTIL